MGMLAFVDKYGLPAKMAYMKLAGVIKHDTIAKTASIWLVPRPAASMALEAVVIK
ncbi:TPA: hypothetical protein ACH3X2_011389 [Trebouxia sp. C0005]